MNDAFGLYLVLTDPVAGYERAAEAAVRQGVGFVQLRMKRRSPEAVLETARALRKITRGTRTLFVVNDFVEIARKVDADGVHLGQDDMALSAARRLWPAPGKRFGLSTHNPEQERLARGRCPDYIGVGPVFATPTKEEPDPVLGPKAMGRIIARSPLCCVAIGGIDAANLPEVLARGAVNFAVVRAVNRNRDPEAAIARLMDIWKEKCSSARLTRSGAAGGP